MDCALPVPAVVQPWLGKELRFHGDLEIQGYRESRRRQPSLAWASSGRYRRFGLPSGVELERTSWVASVIYGPRTNVELWGLAVRLVESDDLVRRRK